MANDKRETTLTNIENLYGRDDHDGAFERAIGTAYDAGHAAAKAEAQRWVVIETVDDLPTEAGRYLWQFRNVDDGIEFDLRIFKPSMDGPDFVKVFVAWKRPAPYQRKSEGE